jgi:chromosome segregation ATPase
LESCVKPENVQVEVEEVKRQCVSERRELAEEIDVLNSKLASKCQPDDNTQDETLKRKEDHIIMLREESRKLFVEFANAQRRYALKFDELSGENEQLRGRLQKCYEYGDSVPNQHVKDMQDEIKALKEKNCKQCLQKVEGCKAEKEELMKVIEELGGKINSLGEDLKQYTDTKQHSHEGDHMKTVENLNKKIDRLEEEHGQCMQNFTYTKFKMEEINNTYQKKFESFRVANRRFMAENDDLKEQMKSCVTSESVHAGLERIKKQWLSERQELSGQIETLNAKLETKCQPEDMTYDETLQRKSDHINSLKEDNKKLFKDLANTQKTYSAKLDKVYHEQEKLQARLDHCYANGAADKYIQGLQEEVKALKEEKCAKYLENVERCQHEKEQLLNVFEQYEPKERSNESSIAALQDEIKQLQSKYNCH